MTVRRPEPHDLPRVSQPLWRWFTWYARRFLRRHMHAVRLARVAEDPRVSPVPIVTPAAPLVVYCNHPSWWDPMVGVFLARRLWPERRHYWPIDADMLRRYRFFARLGFFGIEKDARAGAAAFLRTASAALAQDGACLGLAAQGEFADPRARPVRIKPGLSHLARRMEAGVIVPLAVEYPFWTERTPEVLLRFGDPVPASQRPSTEQLEGALARTMDELAATATARRPQDFVTLLKGTAGASRTYDAWRRARAVLSGRRFDPAHLPEAEHDPDPSAAFDVSYNARDTQVGRT